MKGTIRMSTWTVYKIDKKKEIFQGVTDKIIVEVDGAIINKDGYIREIAMNYFGKDSSIFKEKRYAIKLKSINLLLDHGKTNYDIE